MRVRTTALLALITISCVHGMRHPARRFNITEFTVPPFVYVGQADDVQISCHYVGNFTMLQIFKGTDEIFRFKPSVWPAIRGYPISGIGSIGTDHCGSSSCHVQLNNLTEQASGLYRCDLEHDSPPYLYTTRSANMTVLAAPRRMPFIDGFASEYGEDEDMQAVCRIEPGSMVKWFLNGQELIPLQGQRTFIYKSKRALFLGEPPMVKLQCLEERGYNAIASKTVAALWAERTPANNSSTNTETMKILGSDTVSACSLNYSAKYSITLFILFKLLEYCF